MYKLIARRKRILLASLGVAAALALTSVGVLPQLAFSQTPPPEIFRNVSASRLAPAIILQLPGPADVAAVSQEQARRAVPPELANDLDEVRLVRLRDTASVPAIDVLAWVFSFKNPPPLPSGPLPQTGAARKPTPLPPNGAYWMVVIDAQTGQFVTAFGETW